MSTTVGRLQLVHPDLGDLGGSGLHDEVRAAWTKIADNMSGRFGTVDALADAASQDFTHNFKCAFRELTVLLFERDTGTGELTRLTPATSPALGGFDIIATPGSETTSVRVTNNSGGPQDLAVVIIQNGGRGQGSFTVANNQSSAQDVTPFLFDGSKVKAVIIPFEITRRDDTENRQEVGTLRLVRDADDSVWRLDHQSSFDDCLGSGFGFSVTAAGQVQYTSDNMAGGSYAGTLRFANIIEIPVTP